MEIDAAGNYVVKFPPQARKPDETGNLISELVTELNSGKWPKVATLDIIRYVEKNGTVVAELVKQKSTGLWVRVR